MYRIYGYYKQTINQRVFPLEISQKEAFETGHVWSEIKCITMSHF